ncbi:uncharacterized protein LOC119685845 [Teleopsis dalmanni]|uniref:uncharacterized protein LOC119684739 n=1 Tax=Teleopsis dalmanni TaxID=139649 RepID=UPI0018CFC905|nr:uncharacterized protein LOC119684739 [Teleopsis dalmanni]XP_037956165.1 uncharacterized protein LOC119685845 [Teleopsis dalmanni]
MTELISREKQFIKINENLNRMATTTLEHTSQYHYKTSAYKYVGTATGLAKAKPQSNAMRKRGGGDGKPEQTVAVKGPTKVSEYHQRRTQHVKITSPNMKTARTRIETSTISRTISVAAKENARRETNSIASTVSNSPRRRKTIECTKTVSRHVGPKPGCTFTVKYRNPNFTESPSLAVLVKDECATLRELNEICPIEGNCNVKKQLNSDTMVKFLKSKIIILETNYEKTAKEMIEQKELLDRTLEYHKKLEQQRDMIYAKNSELKEQLSKMESKLHEANNYVKERHTETSNQQKEHEFNKRELKQVFQTNVNLEKRLQRTTEELETSRNALAMLKAAEHETKENIRREFDIKEKQIKSLKKQRADLLNAYKKQLFLIDNLKRQNICYEQTKMLDISEKEFSKVLDWNATP